MVQANKLDQDYYLLMLVRNNSTQLQDGSLSSTAKAYLKNLIDTLKRETRGEGAARFTALKAALNSETEVLKLLNKKGANYQALKALPASTSSNLDQAYSPEPFDPANDSIFRPEEFEA